MQSNFFVNFWNYDDESEEKFTFLTYKGLWTKKNGFIPRTSWSTKFTHISSLKQVLWFGTCLKNVWNKWYRVHFQCLSTPWHTTSSSTIWKRRRTRSGVHRFKPLKKKTSPKLVGNISTVPKKSVTYSWIGPCLQLFESCLISLWFSTYLPRAGLQKNVEMQTRGTHGTLIAIPTVFSCAFRESFNVAMKIGWWYQSNFTSTRSVWTALQTWRQT